MISGHKISITELSRERGRDVEVGRRIASKWLSSFPWGDENTKMSQQDGRTPLTILKSTDFFFGF